MPRPTNKIDLLNASEANFKKLLSLVKSMSEAQQEAKFDFEDRDKCVRDTLAHLYEWHLLLINFIQKNLSGERATFLPQPYNWDDRSEERRVGKECRSRWSPYH